MAYLHVLQVLLRFSSFGSHEQVDEFSAELTFPGVTKCEFACGCEKVRFRRVNRTYKTHIAVPPSRKCFS
jgi:hypothetical protein